MTDTELNNLKDNLWHPADMLSQNGEFQHLNAETVDLQKEIEKNMKDLFGEE